VTSPFGRRYTGVNREWKAWSPAEDAQLRAFAKLCLPWSQAVGAVPGRTASACQTRWTNVLRERDNKPNPRAKMNNDKLAREEHSADGEPIAGGYYVFKVPAGDPYLQRLIKVHGRTPSTVMSI
jgi:hypothetical protein